MATPVKAGKETRVSPPSHMPSRLGRCLGVSGRVDREDTLCSVDSADRRDFRPRPKIPYARMSLILPTLGCRAVWYRYHLAKQYAKSGGNRNAHASARVIDRWRVAHPADPPKTSRLAVLLLTRTDQSCMCRGMNFPRLSKVVSPLDSGRPRFALSMRRSAVTDATLVELMTRPRHKASDSRVCCRRVIAHSTSV